MSVCRQLVSDGCSLSSSDPANRLNSNHDSVGDAEVGFRGAIRNSNHENFRDNEQFCFQAQIVQEGFGAYSSPPLWKNDTQESFPLLPCDHQYSNLSHRTRLQAIVEGRKELFEMIHSMPENSYELSLRDIVDEQQQTIVGKDKEEVKDLDDKSFCFESEAEIENQKKKSMKASGRQIARTSSKHSEIFLIKMFRPRCLGSKMNTTNKNGSSKISPRAPFEISEKHSDYKEQRIKRILAAREDKGSGKICTSSSTSNSKNSRISRLASNFSVGCCHFLIPRKVKAAGRQDPSFE